MHMASLISLACPFYLALSLSAAFFLFILSRLANSAHLNSIVSLSIHLNCHRNRCRNHHHHHHHHSFPFQPPVLLHSADHPSARPPVRSPLPITIHTFICHRFVGKFPMNQQQTTFVHSKITKRNFPFA